MKCPKCGKDVQENIRFCPNCGANLSLGGVNNASVPTVGGNNDKIPFYLQMWFIIIIFFVSMFIWCIPAIVLFIIRIIKFPTKRKSAWIAVGSLLGVTIIACVLLYFIGTADIRAVDKLVKEQKYDEALHYVEEHYDSKTDSYYERKAEIYEAKGDYDAAASQIIALVDNKDDITTVYSSTKEQLENYKDKCSEDTIKNIDSELASIEAAIVAKEEAEKKAAEEKAAKEAAEKEAAEKKAAEEKAAKEAADKEAAEKKAAEEKAAKEAEEKAAKEAAEAEKKAKEAEEKSIVQNAQTLGVDLVMESHNSSYEGKYFKTEGTIEEIKGNAYRIRYLSTVANHKRMYKLWINSSDTSNLYEGENVTVVGQYVGFAEGSSVPTIEEYKIDKSTDVFYSTLSQKAKVINRDISFDNLLRYGEYQEFLYVEGTVTYVYDSNFNIDDEYGNSYIIFDHRANPGVLLQGDYVRIYGQFEGIKKSGYVWPRITWLVDGN